MMRTSTLCFALAWSFSGCSGEPPTPTPGTVVPVSEVGGVANVSPGVPNSVAPAVAVPGANLGAPVTANPDVVPVVPGNGVPGNGVPGNGVPGNDVPGNPSTANPSTANPSGLPACDSPEPLARSIRSLSGLHYRNTIEAVFPGATEGLDNPHEFSDASSEFSSGASVARFDFKSTQTVLENARLIGDRAAEAQMASEACLANGAAACVEGWIRRVGRQLYRAPVSDSEVSKLSGLFEVANSQGEPTVGVAQVIRAMVSSTQFLFRRELGTQDAAGTFKLTPYEAAEALAYTLTDAPPDALLSQAADAAGSADEVLASQLPRLLESGDIKRPGMTRFIEELFVTRTFLEAEKDPELFPKFNDAVRQAVAEDFTKTVDGFLASDSPTFQQLLLTREYYVGEGTQELLGWPGSDGDTLTTIPEPSRIGLLTHPLMLGNYARQEATNPVARGHFVSDKLLCVHVPAPPPGTDVEFPETPVGAEKQTLRQRLEAQHSVGGCAGCHALMDPMGYPFEVFDSVGAERTLDNGLPIDATGAIAGSGEIDGPVANHEELLERVANSGTAHACFTQSAFEFVAGVTETPAVKCQAANLAQRFVQQGGAIPSLFGEILSSSQFLTRVEPQ